MTETITIARIGQEKVIEYTNKKTGKPDSFKKVGVQTNEYGERWFDITFRGECPVKVGQTCEGEVSEREYNGKTYYDFKLPKEERGGGGMSPEQFAIINRRLEAIYTRLGIVLGHVDTTTSDGKPMPNFDSPAAMVAPVSAEPPEFTDDDFAAFAPK
jgi:hypothetical protein